ncbi:MAG TPA: PDZ domain-containing protein [Blastocatellia bacterium]|nr:PDZ domain-containing protein [Blastocatellia bacterium]
MTHERHRQLSKLYHDALELEPAQRSAFLDDACGVDEALRREVESLIASHQQVEGFIEAPAINVAEDLSNQAEAPTQLLPDLPVAKPAFFWIALLLGSGALAVYVFSGIMISRYAGLTKEFGWKYGSDSQNVFVREVDPEGAAAGKLQVGDRILSINDETLVSRVAPLYVLRTIAVESDYTIRVQRSGDEVILKLSLPPLAHDSSYLGPLLSRLLVSAVFLILAMLIGLVRPGERIAQLACIGSISGAMIEVESALKPMVAFFHGPENVIYALLSAIFTTMSWAIAYHFFYRFPPGVPKGRLWLFLKWLFYSWAAVICIILVSQRLGYLINNRTMIAILFRPDLYLKVIPAFSSPFFILLPFALVGIIVPNYRLIKEPDQRRRMKWVIYGSIAATAPTIVNAIIFFLLVTFGQRGVTQSYFQLGDWSRRLDLISDLAFVIVPITFSYAIIKHRVFDINVVVRRGLQYVLARNVLQVILALPLIGLGYQLISNPNQTVADIVFRNPMYLLLAAAAAISLKYRRRVTGWIDRKFFREAYNQEQILIGLMDEIKELDSMADISRLVSGKLDSALHLPRIYVFYREPTPLIFL